ncbi:hypothetical protein DXG03_005773 [Asterophora parasitica]|uniref:Uncharacterized protein n=1 Tax=Asterophora parasitica TaxID=117018 RepID=A0A9P7G638_9AGAR|nr:hypothetical protein DXG03_005773 [Asterophora parasitica]
MKDYLPDEAPHPLGLYGDEHGFHRDSPWKTWEHSAESSLLAVLALEKLGSHYFMPDKEPPQRVKGLRKSLRAMVDDITQEGVYHNDIAAFNICWFPKSRGRFARAIIVVTNGAWSISTAPTRSTPKIAAPGNSNAPQPKLTVLANYGAVEE